MNQPGQLARNQDQDSVLESVSENLGELGLDSCADLARVLSIVGQP